MGSGCACVGLRLDVAKGWHINAHVLSEASRGALTETDVIFEEGPGFVVSGRRYPKGSVYESDFSDGPLDVYDGRVEASFDLKAADNLRPGSYELRGRLKVQACNEEFCLGPAEKPVVWSIPVE